MANLNKVFLIGRLTADPILRYTPSQVAVTELRLAINRSWTGKDGERKEETLFIDVTVWNRQAENCCQYLKKGRSAHVEGYLKMDTWDDKTTGEKRSKIKIEAETVQFLDSKREEGGGSMDSHEADEFAAPPPRRGSAPAEPRGQSNGPSAGFRTSATPPPRRPPVNADPEGDDDIPF